MANQVNGNENMSVFDKMVAWYAGHAYLVGAVYSVGAAVVIVGALFKIQHWQGASTLLTVGMCTEALLFVMGLFEKPHPVYNWENVFPQLIGHDAKPVAGGASSASAPALAEGDVKALKESIANVSAAANSLADLGKLAEGSNKLSEKLAAAAEATDKFAGAQTGVAQAADSLGANYVAAAKAAEAIKNDTEAAAQSQAAAAKNLAALNAAYELNLKSAQAAAEEAKKLADNNAAAAKAGEAFAAAQDKLAKQVADLNKVYGNMLTALA